MHSCRLEPGGNVMEEPEGRIILTTKGGHQDLLPSDKLFTLAGQRGQSSAASLMIESLRSSGATDHYPKRKNKSSWNFGGEKYLKTGGSNKMQTQELVLFNLQCSSSFER